MRTVRSLNLLTLLAFDLFFVFTGHCFYLPALHTAPIDFRKEDPLIVKVNNRLSSVITQLPYPYHSLPFCHQENGGEDLIEDSPYVFQMLENQVCAIICRITLNKDDEQELKDRIDEQYRVNMILDDLPLVVPITWLRKDTIYERGFHVGFKGQFPGSNDKYFIYNHLSFVIKHHKDPETDLARIVGFSVKPFSVKHEYQQWNGKNTRLSTCDPHYKRIVMDSNHGPQEVEEDSEIIFTYDVEFQESDAEWASRWDAYRVTATDRIRWYSIINSLITTLFLSGMVGMIMVRALIRDISKYTQLESQEEAQEESGWKSIHGDVFRPPTNPELLCVHVGNGVQFFCMILVTLMLAVSGLLNPINRGELTTTMLLLWASMGLFAGYSSARLYRVLKGEEWKKITLKTAFMFPAVVFVTLFILNALVWHETSSGAVATLVLMLLWFGIYVPLVFAGGYVGFEKLPVEDPVKTKTIPWEIPKKPWYMNPVFAILIGGMVTFSSVFIELNFLITSIWFQQFYYLLGLHLLVFSIFVVTCGEIAILLCYFQLCREDYLWWWRAFFTSGSSGFYLFLYATIFFFTNLEMTKPVSGLLYFGYMLIASYALFVLTGTIGFLACFLFTRLIYSSLKID